MIVAFMAQAAEPDGWAAPVEAGAPARATAVEATATVRASDRLFMVPPESRVGAVTEDAGEPTRSSAGRYPPGAPGVKYPPARGRVMTIGVALLAILATLLFAAWILLGLALVLTGRNLP